MVPSICINYFQFNSQFKTNNHQFCQFLINHLDQQTAFCYRSMRKYLHGSRRTPNRSGYNSEESSYGGKSLWRPESHRCSQLMIEQEPWHPSRQQLLSRLQLGS